jgi:hypothetical protein
MAEFEDRTEILTSMIGRDKLCIDDLDATLKKGGDDGWELGTGISLSSSSEWRRRLECVQVGTPGHTARPCVQHARV